MNKKQLVAKAIGLILLAGLFNWGTLGARTTFREYPGDEITTSPTVTTPSQVSIGALPVPGKDYTSNFLTLAQAGIILENDQLQLKWQSDGNLVIYYYGTEVVWASNTARKGHILSFDPNERQLAIKDSDGKDIWSSNTSDASVLQLNADHNLVILNSQKKTIWQSGTTLTHLNDDGESHTIGSNGSTPQTFLVPTDTDYKYLYLRAEGGDGGARKITYSPITVVHVAGGEGATVIAAIPIGTGEKEIPPGSTLRLIVGLKGATRVAGTTAGSPGGAGTGVLFKKPGESNWTLLMVAGGGGGAYSDYGAVKREGHPAESGENGGRGGGDGGAYGGKDGSYGGDQANTHSSGGLSGGGAYEGDPYRITAGQGGWEGARFKNSNGSYIWNRDTLPNGGKGGPTSQWGNVAGPWGFGGGGSGGTSGGGGGGYSGGGCGLDYYPGGGGGSYLNTSFGFYQQTIRNDRTTSPGNGSVLYRFFKEQTEIMTTIRLAMLDTKCIDLQNNNTAKGSNIQLVQCKNNSAQQWVVEGSTIRLASTLNKCIDLDRGKTANGSNIQLWDCNDTYPQKWLYDVATQSIHTGVDFNKCMDLTNSETTGGTNIQLYDCNHTGAQKWIIDGIPSTMPTGSNKRILLVKDPNKCIDVKDGRTTNGTNIQVYDCPNTNSQYFLFDGRTIRMQSAPNMCLDMDPTEKSYNVRLWECNGNNSQEWIYDGFGRSFRSAVEPDKLCLYVEDGNTDNGANIRWFACLGLVESQFEIY